jgi:hypothetical protein
MGTLRTEIRGLYYYHAEEEHSSGNIKKGSSLLLVPEPDNPHDKNAIEIKNKQTGKKLGYIPKEQAIQMQRHLLANKDYVARIISIRRTGNRLFIDIDIVANWIENPNRIVTPSFQGERLTQENFNLREAAGKSGIYQILNTVNGKRYIGQSTNISRRWAEHLDLLTKGLHHSSKLQREWNQYGEVKFKFQVLKEVTDTANLDLIEEEYIQKFNSYHGGYNSSPKAKPDFHQVGINRNIVTAVSFSQRESKNHNTSVNNAVEGNFLKSNSLLRGNSYICTSYFLNYILPFVSIFLFVLMILLYIYKFIVYGALPWN